MLYYFNFFIVFSSIFFLTFWVQSPSIHIPIPLIIILSYGVATIITYIIIKKPVKMKILGVWTSFLVIVFTMMILEITLFTPNFYWFSWIPIGIFLTAAIIVTILDYISNK